MKKLAVWFFSSLLLIIGMPNANANSLIIITKPTTQLADGVFINNDLAQAILPSGELGMLLLAPPRGVRTWLIDPALIEEIKELSDGYVYLDESGEEVSIDEYPIAQSWIDSLILNSRNDRVVSLTYGSPSWGYLQQVAPGELAFYNQLSKFRLQMLLGREVSGPGNAAPNAGQPQLVAKNSYTLMRKQMRVINSLVKTGDVEDLRLGLAKTLNSNLNKDIAVGITRSYFEEVAGFQNRIRISPGNYTITSSAYDLPVTIINDFAQEVSVDLDVTTTNSRVVVGAVNRITIAANSQTQINLPIEVIASGETALRLQILTPKGSVVGELERIPLRLAVISPITTWFTTGMAIILLLAAIVQSVRRIKRRKQHE